MGKARWRLGLKFLRRKVIQPIIDLLKQGITPERIALTIALGVILGVTPVLAGLGAQGALLLSTSDLALPRTAATVQDALSMLQRNN